MSNQKLLDSVMEEIFEAERVRQSIIIDQRENSLEKKELLVRVEDLDKDMISLVSMMEDATQKLASLFEQASSLVQRVENSPLTEEFVKAERASHANLMK
jgi:hypothetical protein